MDSKMSPSSVYESSEGEVATATSTGETQDNEDLPQWQLQEILDEVPTDAPVCIQYYVENEGEDEETLLEGQQGHGHDNDADEEGHDAGDNGFKELLQLPRISLPRRSKTHPQEKIDYHKSLLLTQEDHVNELESLATKRDEAAKERQRREFEKEANKTLRAQQQQQNFAAKQARKAAAAAKKIHNEL